MIAIALGITVAALLVWSAQLSMRGADRMRNLPVKQRMTTKTHHPLRTILLLQSLGRKLAKLPGVRTLPETAAMQRAIGIAAVLCPALAVRFPLLAAVIAAVVIGLPMLRIRTLRMKHERAIERDMPMFIDLVNLGVGSGLTVNAAITYVSEKIESPISDVFRVGLSHVGQGRRFAEVLQDCETHLGEGALPLTSVLLSAERYGSPVGPLLAQLAQETRFDQERRTEQAARRLSVQLIFPLAGCILPAFALLTAAPLLAGSIGTLASSFH